MTGVTAHGEGAKRITDAFAGHGKRAALMPYVMGGYPDLATSREIGMAYIAAGADLIELGFPHSDPMADGPVIQRAGMDALANGTKLAEVIEIGRDLGRHVPVVLMTYGNVALSGGVERFAAQLAAAGISGALMPDIPLEESDSIRAAFDSQGVALAALVTPGTSEERMKRIGANARGFLYTVTVTGPTGERERLASGTEETLARARASTDLPVAIGFGISTPEHAREAAGLGAEGVIVASRLMREAGETDRPAERLGEIVGEFAAALAV